MRIVIVAGHVGIEQLRADGLCPGRDIAQLRRGTGSRGERELMGDLAERLAGALRADGHDAIATDAAGGDDVRAPADLLIALHAQRDSSSSRAFAGSADPLGGYVSAVASEAAAEWCAIFNRDYPVLTGIPTTPERVNANITEHYLWCYVQRETVCVLAELGNMDLDGAALYSPPPLGVVAGAVLEITRRWAAPRPDAHPPTPVPRTIVPVMGAPSAGVDLAKLARALWKSNPRASIAIPRLYLELAPLAGVRPEIAFAQAMHETGWLTYPRIARPEWNNYAGIGCREDTPTCAIFGSEEEGVRGHIGHVLCYYGPHVPAFCDLDPKHDAVGHRNLANDLLELGGVDPQTQRVKWAPARDYGANIASGSLLTIMSA